MKKNMKSSSILLGGLFLPEAALAASQIIVVRISIIQ